MNARSIYALAREVGLTPDDRGYAGELRRLFDRPGIKRAICRRSGLTVDNFAELAWSRGLTAQRLDCNAMLELLELAIGTTRCGRPCSESARDRSVIEAAEHAIEVRRTTRLRLYVCTGPGCPKKIRVADDYLDASHNHFDPDTNVLQVYPFARVTPELRPVAPF